MVEYQWKYVHDRREDKLVLKRVKKRKKKCREKGICSYCGAYRRLTLDHVVPKSKGGRATIPACSWCNGTKGDKNLREWLMWIGTETTQGIHAPQFSLVPHYYYLEAQEIARIKFGEIDR